jgi:integrase
MGAGDPSAARGRPGAPRTPVPAGDPILASFTRLAFAQPPRLAVRHALRISEVVDLRLADIDLTAGCIFCRSLFSSGPP